MKVVNYKSYDVMGDYKSYELKVDMNNEAVHINYPEGYSNYRLRSEPVNFKTTVTPVLDGRNEQSWENEGGALAPPAYEYEESRRYDSFMRVRGSRKQRAARRMVPINSITKVPVKVQRTVEQSLEYLKNYEDATKK